MRIESLHDALAFFPDIDGFWNVQSLVEAESRILNQLPVDWANQPSPRAVELLTQLARAQALQNDLPKARETLDQARQLIGKLEDKLEPRLEVRWLLEQGRVLCLGMSPVRAHDYFVQAWTLANDHGLEFFAVDAALMLSTVRPPKFQNEWLQKAFAVANASADENVRKWLPQLLFLEGWHAFDFRQFEKALKCFEDAIQQPHAGDESWKMMTMQWSRARVLRALGQVEAALTIQESLLSQIRTTGSMRGHIYLEIAECQQLLKRPELAKSNFEMAYQELSAPGWYADNRVDELNRMKYLFKKR